LRISAAVKRYSDIAGPSKPVISLELSSESIEGIVGNPKLSPGTSQHWIFKNIPEAEYEARIVGELLTSRPLIGPDATKAAVLHQIEQVEVIHFCTHISWKLSSIVLAPSENIPSQHRFPSIDTMSTKHTWHLQIAVPLSVQRLRQS
jgi:hypothetical protein